MNNIIDLILWCVVVTTTFHLCGINWLTVGYWGVAALVKPLIYRLIFERGEK